MSATQMHHIIYKMFTHLRMVKFEGGKQTILNQHSTFLHSSPRPLSLPSSCCSTPFPSTPFPFSFRSLPISLSPPTHPLPTYLSSPALPSRVPNSQFTPLLPTSTPLPIHLPFPTTTLLTLPPLLFHTPLPLSSASSPFLLADLSHSIAR